MEKIVSGLPVGTREASPRKVDTIFSFLYGGESLPSARIKKFNVIYRNSDRLASRLGQVDSLVEEIQSDIQLCVAEMASSRLFLHCGVIAWNDKAILIPGRSQSGKSTLVRAFIEAGATYYSDEYALIDRRFRVHPFARPIHVRDNVTFETRPVTPGELGATVGRKPLHVTLIILTAFDKGASWCPRKVSGGKVALKILRQCVSVRRQPGVLLKLVNRLVSSASVFASRRGEAREVVEWCLATLSK
jgi:hypothetical protein